MALGGEHFREGAMAANEEADGYAYSTGAFDPMQGAASALRSEQWWLDLLQPREPGVSDAWTGAARSIDRQASALVDAMALFDAGTDASSFAPQQEGRLLLDRLAAPVALP